MITYIALLRGINVGGKNKVGMKDLKLALEELGFSDVITYINSGNVVFRSDNVQLAVIKSLIEVKINEVFGLNIPVLVISHDHLDDIVKHAPSWWDINKQSVDYVIFAIPPTSVSDVMSAVGDIKPEYENIAFYQQSIYWSAPLETFSKSRWSKIASSSVNNNVTIRNANTVNKLLAIAKKI